MSNKKTISGGSDGSAGFITGGTGVGVPQASPNPANQSDDVREILDSQKAEDILSTEKAQKLIQSAVRGAMEAILSSLNSKSVTGAVQPISSAAIAAHISEANDTLGTSAPQVDPSLNTINVTSSRQPSSPTTVTTEPIPAMDVVNTSNIQQTVYDNSPIKQVDATVVADTQSNDNDYANAMEPANIPLSVPNYHKPDGPTTKICATCKYFNKKSDSTGDCFAYGFVAIADHTCDSWAVGMPATNGVDSDRTRDIENPIGQPVPNEIAPKYREIDFYPNQVMAQNAAAAIEARDQHIGEQRGITPYAEACARRIIQKQILMPENWRRIYSYYVDNKFDPVSQDTDTKGPLWQQWMAWGGNEAFERAKQVIAAMNQADEDEAAGFIDSTGKSVRSISAKRMKKITQASGPSSVTTGGEVIGSDFEPLEGEEGGLAKPEHLSSSVTPELSLNHGRNKTAAFYLPGERVYSKSSRSLGEIVKSQHIDNQHIYNIKLINNDGLVHGSAIVHEADLTPRSVRAIKRMQIKSIRESVEGYVNQVIKALEELDATHSDYKENPITSDIVAATEKSVQDILASDTFAEASSKMGMRKYVRAMQDVEHSLGAATHILRSSEELASSSDSTKDSQTLSDYGQRNTVGRIKQCIERAKECLLDEVPMRSFAAKGQ